MIPPSERRAAPPGRRERPAGLPRSYPSERIVEYLHSVHELTGLRFRAVMRSDGEFREVYDCLGDVSADAVEEHSWEVFAGTEVRVAIADASGRAAQAVVPLLRESLCRLLASERDARFFSDELEERYEEITLLTSISETLGSIVHLERAAGKLLDEVAQVMEAHFAGLWVSEAAELVLFAAGGSGSAAGDRIPVRDERSEVARVFSSQRPLLRESWVPHAPGDEAEQADGGSGAGQTGAGQTGATAAGDATAHETLIAVPVRHSALHGRSRAVGVLELRGDPTRPSFSQADAKLAAAIASHLAAAIENGRLVRESLEQERMLVELELAHDLQLKLLPEPDDFSTLGDVAARCEPAESVGGDFYHLFRLPGERLGVMLGDVSSHGYSAGLIMALTMSAASIVVREREQPADVLKGIHHELVRKLESTEMYMTLCYAVLDARAGRLLYANAGHPHAYRIGPLETVRLEALNPPLGIAEFDSYAQKETEWHQGLDTLLMFTDGVSECLRTDQLWSDEILTAIAREGANARAHEVLDRLFTLACVPGDVAADDRTALVVK